MTLDHQIIWLAVAGSVSLRAYGLSALGVDVQATDAPITLNLQSRQSSSDDWQDVPHTAVTLTEAGSAQVHFNADTLGPLVRLNAVLDSEDEADVYSARAVLITRQR